MEMPKTPGQTKRECTTYAQETAKVAQRVAVLMETVGWDKIGGLERSELYNALAEAYRAVDVARVRTQIAATS